MSVPEPTLLLPYTSKKDLEQYKAVWFEYSSGIRTAELAGSMRHAKYGLADCAAVLPEVKLGNVYCIMSADMALDSGTKEFIIKMKRVELVFYILFPVQI